MTNYIKSEFYRVFRTKALYIMTGACLMVVLLFLTVLWAMSVFTVDFPWATTKYAFSTLETGMNIPLYLSAVMGSLVVSDEFKYKTFNNSVAFGIPRELVYLCKVVVGMAASAICLLVTETGLIGGGYLLLENSGAAYTLSLLKGTAACIPAWIAGMVAFMSLYYVTGSRSASIWIWLLVIVAAPAVVSVLGMRFEFCARLASWLLYPMVSSVTPTEEWLEFNWSTAAGFLKCQEAGIIGVAVFITLGIMAIRRKEL